MENSKKHKVAEYANYYSRDGKLYSSTPLGFIGENLSLADAKRLVFKTACEAVEYYSSSYDWQSSFSCNKTNIKFHHEYKEDVLIGKLWDEAITVREKRFEVVEMDFQFEEVEEETEVEND